MHDYKLTFTFTSIKDFFKKHTFISSFLSGILFATPFMCEWLFPLVFLSLIFLFCVLESRKKDCFFRAFFLFFFGCCLIVYTLFFKLYPFEGFNFTKGQSIAIVLFGWLASSLIHSILFGTILGISRVFKKEPLLFSLSIASLWVIFEWSLSLGQLAFPWISISVSLIKFLPYLQTASLFGNGFITFVTVFSTCCISKYLVSKDRKYILKLGALVLTLNTLAGTILFLFPEKKEKELSVCVVQGNVSMGDKWKGGNIKQILLEHDALIRDALEKEKCDTVILAETVFPAIYSKDGIIHKVLSDIAKEYDVTIIFGAIIKAEPHIPSSTKKYNTMIALYPDGTSSEPYRKRKLVPFGEKTPYLGVLSLIVPALDELDMEKDSYVEGTESGTIADHNGTLYGPLVCYDSVFSNFAMENSRKGAEIIAVSTNDSWYKDGKALWQHQSHSVIRAIENGKYVIRSANTGVSCIINSKGIITAESEILTSQTVCGTIYASKSNTLYTIIGNISLYLSFASIPLFFIIKAIKSKKSTKND